MRVALRIAAGLGLAALSGLLLTLAFPPFDLWPLVAIGWVPAVVAQHRVLPRRLGGLGYGVGLGAFFWGYYGPMFAGTVWFMEWLPLFAGGLAALLSSGDRAFHERTGYRWFVLEGAVVWVGIEAIRGFTPVIGTGGFVAYALYTQPWLLQPVALVSIYGLSLLIMLVNYALALGVLRALDRRAAAAPAGGGVPAGRAAAWLGGMAAVLVVWIGTSLFLLGQAAAPGPAVHVAAVQPGLIPGMAARLNALMARTREAAAAGAQLVVWPEGALTFDPRAVHTADLRALARETGAYLAFGFAPPVSGGGLENAAVVLAPDGTFSEPYGKTHPVVWLGEQSAATGTHPTIATPLGTVGTIICYDLNFTDAARAAAAGGAQIVAVPSTDWAGLAPRQYSNLVLRAVENRIALIKADVMYDSAIIDPTGRIVALALTTDGAATTLHAVVLPGAANAPLIVWGDWLGWVAIAGTLAFAIAGMWSSARVGQAHLAPRPAG